MTACSSIPFEIHPSLPKNFPKQLDFKEEDHLTCQSYEESYFEAQNAGLPYYVVVVVESLGNDLTKNFYHTYDRNQFETYRAKIKKECQPLYDPISRGLVMRAHCFAVKCFESDPENLFRPSDPSKGEIKLTSFPEPLHEVKDEMLKEALTAGNLQMRRTQYLLAQWIKSGDLFLYINPAEKRKEVLLWLWCSAKGSHQAVLSLFKECIAEPTLASPSYYNGLLLKTSQIKDPKLPRLEREAILEARCLLKN